jgi:hypothetical protein
MTLLLDSQTLSDPTSHNRWVERLGGVAASCWPPQRLPASISTRAPLAPVSHAMLAITALQ